MPLYVGNEKLSSLYVGGEKIIKAYLGSDLVYQAGPASRLGNTVQFGGYNWIVVHENSDNTSVLALENIYSLTPYSDQMADYPSSSLYEAVSNFSNTFDVNLNQFVVPTMSANMFHMWAFVPQKDTLLSYAYFGSRTSLICKYNNKNTAWWLATDMSEVSDPNYAFNVSTLGTIVSGNIAYSYGFRPFITIRNTYFDNYINLADPTSPDWVDNKRINSSGSEVVATGVTLTNYIPVIKGQVLRVKGLDWRVSDSASPSYGNNQLVLYDGQKNIVHQLNIVSNTHLNTIAPISDDTITYQLFSYSTPPDSTSPDSYSISNIDSVAYIRIQGHLMSGYDKNSVVITIDQEIN